LIILKINGKTIVSFKRKLSIFEELHKVKQHRNNRESIEKKANGLWSRGKAYSHKGRLLHSIGDFLFHLAGRIKLQKKNKKIKEHF